jgi:PTH2 family peptidyl-tRNA hydrolase
MTHKQVIVVRKDLGMRKGKCVAQGAHASLGAILSLMARHEDGSRTLPADDRVNPWLDHSFTKPVVYVTSEAELLEIHSKATEAGLIACLIRDNGTTEFKGVPTYTAVAVGPDLIEKVDEITGHLPLF